VFGCGHILVTVPLPAALGRIFARCAAACVFLAIFGQPVRKLDSRRRNHWVFSINQTGR
jgi:hypothetical protein